MAIKALKQSVSISETQKMIHQWKAKGITDSATLKLLDLLSGTDTLHDCRRNISHAQPLPNLPVHENHAYHHLAGKHQEVLLIRPHLEQKPYPPAGILLPLWCDGLKNTPAQAAGSVAELAVPVASPATTAANQATTNNSVLYNINNIIPPEDSRKGDPAGNGARKAKKMEADAGKTPSETPDGEKTSQTLSPATDFFHQLNTTPEDKQRVLIPLINRIATSHNYTRPRALQTLVILVNQFLIPHFNADPRFSRNSHAGRIIWLQNLMKTRHGQSLMEQAVARLSSELSKDLEEKRRKLREFRPVSPFEWKDAGTDIRYYDNPIDGKVEIPENAPPQPVETAIWNVLSKEWIDTGD